MDYGSRSCARSARRSTSAVAACGCTSVVATASWLAATGAAAIARYFNAAALFASEQSSQQAFALLARLLAARIATACWFAARITTVVTSTSWLAARLCTAVGGTSTVATSSVTTRRGSTAYFAATVATAAANSEHSVE